MQRKSHNIEKGIEWKLNYYAPSQHTAS